MTTTKLIPVHSWGPGSIGNFKVRVPGDCDPGEELDFIQRSIERRTGLTLATFKGEGTSLQRGEPAALHYQGTLARPCRGGGWTPVSEIWISVPIRREGGAP